MFNVNLIQLTECKKRQAVYNSWRTTCHLKGLKSIRSSLG